VQVPLRQAANRSLTGIFQRTRVNAR